MRNGSDIIEALTEEEESTGWIVTYADLVTLLLVFFVLLFSISSLNLEKFKHAMNSLQVHLGESRPAINILSEGETDYEAGTDLIVDITNPMTREEALLKDIDSVIREEVIEDNIIVQTSGGKVSIMVKDKALFAKGDADISISARPVLNKIAMLINEYSEYTVNIKGFTDNLPISTERFPSNWELSAVRATTVLKFLIGEGVGPERMTATGYGELMPIVPNDTEENRSMNRRVEFVLEKIRKR